MGTSRRSLFGMLAVAPVVLVETAKAFKAFKEAPEPPKLKAEASTSTFVSYGGGFYIGSNS